MLPFFADPYPDELLYSACARYHRWAGNPDLKDTLFELFGRTSAIPSLCFGSDLQHLCDALGGIYNPEKLLHENTIFPLYSPFLPEKRTAELAFQMRGSCGNGIVAKIGAAAGSICEKDGISYCPGCVASDRESYGDIYIHRLHQVQGVLVCPEHGYLLRHIMLPPDTSRIEYIDLDHVMPDEYIAMLPDVRYAGILRKIAECAQYLLTHDLNFVNKEKVTLRYKQLLYRRELVNGTGRIKQNDYLSQLQAFYGSELLELIDSIIDPDNEYTWAKVIVRNTKRTVHPLRHILLINFLTDMDTFFEGIRDGDLFAVKSFMRDHTKDDGLLMEYEDNLLKMIQQHPKLSRTEIRRLCEREYSYIYRRDRKWLMRNLPDRLPFRTNTGYIDWECRDTEYCRMLRKAYRACKAEGGRISATRLIRRAGIQANMENRRNKLPKAWKYLKTVSQSIEEYQIERCLEVIRNFNDNKEHFSKWRLLRIAGLTEERFRNIKAKLKQKMQEKRMEDISL